MKKLIVFSVIFALIAGSVFAVDLGGEVIGTYHVLDMTTNATGADGDEAKLTTHGGMNRLRLQGDGENDDGTFGAWIRVDGSGDNAGEPSLFGLAWWKPLDALRIRIGGNPDGIWGKEGWTGWMFRQRINDTGVVKADEAWAGPWHDYNVSPGYFISDWKFRSAFYGGYGDNRLALEITPMDMLAINIGLPFGGSIRPYDDRTDNLYDDFTGDVLGALHAQLDLNFDFGNIALTFEGDHGDKGRMFAYFGLTAIENLGLDIGAGIPLNFEDDSGEQIAIGVGLNVGISDTIGLRFRALASLGGGKDSAASDWTGITAGVLPSFVISDNAKFFIDIGLNMAMYGGDDKDIDNVIGFHANPYIWIGEEWGPSFWAGINIWTDGDNSHGKKGEDPQIHFEIPIAIGLSF